MFFERPESGELVVLVHLDVADVAESDDPREFEELVLSAGGNPVAFIVGQRQSPHPKFYVGTGKLDEIRSALLAHDAELVIFNHGLSPSQERNLEKALNCRVLDRSGLILDIFAQRARTHEGKLQVELAQLEYMSTRLVRGWTHLERQKGGIGLRGPGETQLETDRRLLRARIKSINKRLEKVRKQRDQGRRSRRRAEVPTVSIVGYTNAGKSTLFNGVTQSTVYAADQLFATLDPTMRRIELEDVGAIVLADTVGFIRHLPHKLVEAFRATLEEASLADLLIHVVDACDNNRDDNIVQVEEVLKEIDALSIARLEVFNKIDLLGDFAPRIDRDQDGRPVRVWLSARTGHGTTLLRQALDELLTDEILEGTVSLGADMSKIRSKIYDLGTVKKEIYQDSGEILLTVRLNKVDWLRLARTESFDPNILAVNGN